MILSPKKALPQSPAIARFFRDECLARRNIEANERSAARLTVKNAFELGEEKVNKSAAGLPCASNTSFALALASTYIKALEEGDRKNIEGSESLACACILKELLDHFLCDRPDETNASGIMNNESEALVTSASQLNNTQLFDESMECELLSCTVLVNRMIVPRSVPHCMNTPIGIHNTSSRLVGFHEATRFALNTPFQRGDVLVLINGQRVWRLADVAEWEGRVRRGETPYDTHYITVLRQGAKVHVKLSALE